MEQAPGWYTHQFNDNVMDYYSAGGYELRGTVTPPEKMEGEYIYFPFIGEFFADEVVRKQQSNDQNVQHDLISVPWKHYEVQSKRLIVDLDKTTINTNEAYARGHAKAMGRKHTNLLLTTMDATAGLTTVGAYANAWGLDPAAEAATAIYEQTEDDQEMAYCALPHRAFSQMMTFKEFASADWTGTDDLPFVKRGSRKTWRDVHWFALPERKGKKDPYFPISGTNLDFFMWKPSAIGSGGPLEEIRNFVAFDIKVQGGGWDHKTLMGVGNKILQKNGLIRCQMKEDSPITFI